MNTDFLLDRTTVRTWLAGQALAGLCANQKIQMPEHQNPAVANFIAAYAVFLADRTIDTLNNPPA